MYVRMNAGRYFERRIRHSVKMSVTSDDKNSWLGPGVRSILRNGAYLLGAGWLATALRAIYVVVLARALGPEDYGLLSSAMALYLMFVVGGTAGIATYVSREVSAGRAERGDALWSAFMVEAAFLTAGALAFLILTVFLYTGGGVEPIFILLALSLVFRGWAAWSLQAFIASEASHYQISLVSLFRTAEVLLAVAALAAGGGLVAVVVIHLASWALEAAFGIWVVHVRLASWSTATVAWQRLLSYGQGLATVSVAVSASTWLRLAPLALYPYIVLNSGDTGQFALAWNAAMVIATAVLTVMNAAIPVLSRAHARADEKDMYYLSVCIRYGTLFGSAAAIAGVSLGAWLITVAVGERYASAGPLFVAALWTTGPIVVGHALDQTLFLRGRTQFCIFFNTAALVILLVVFALTLRSHGSLAAVAAAASIMSVAVIVKIAFVRTLVSIDLLKPGLMAAACAVTGIASALALAAYAPVIASVAGLFVLMIAAFLTDTIYPREGRMLCNLLRTRKST